MAELSVKKLGDSREDLSLDPAEEKRRKWKAGEVVMVAVLAIAAAALLAAVYSALHQPPVPYPMMAEAEVADKYVDDTGYYLAIDRCYDWSAAEFAEYGQQETDGILAVRCSRQEYLSTVVGDVADVLWIQEGDAATLESIEVTG